MKVTVEVDWDLCQHHGQCCFISPETFELDDSGKMQLLTAAPGIDRLEEVEDAADACPVQAITVRTHQE